MLTVRELPGSLVSVKVRIGKGPERFQYQRYRYDFTYPGKFLPLEQYKTNENLHAAFTLCAMSASSRRSIDTAASPRSRPGSSRMSTSAHEGLQRPSLSGPRHSRRSSVASSITSVGGPLPSPATRLRDPITESTNNAISTLLQPPIVRTGLLPHTSGPGAPKPPSTRDIPPVTLTNIPPVDDKLFRDYITQADQLFESFRRAKEDNEDGRPPSSRSGSRSGSLVGDISSSIAQKHIPTSPQLNRTDSSSSTTALDYAYRRKSSSGTGRRAGPVVAPLSTIPSVYFEEGFRLENPRTFDVVSERAEIVRPPVGANGTAIPPGGTGKKALAANAILQEKLSWYMDTVEIHLISSISTASTSFFAALGSLRELHAEAEESVSKIKVLRENLNSLDSKMATGGLKIVALKRKRENVRRLGEAIHQLEEIVRLMAECEAQVENGEIEEALKGLVSLERLMAGDADDLPAIAQSHNPLGYKGSIIDLRGIRALEGASRDIAYVRKRIGRAYEAKFIEVLLEDLRKHVDTAPSNVTFQRWDKASSRLRGQHVRTPSEMPSYMSIDGAFRSILNSYLKGLARSDSIMTAAVAYREAVLKEFKNIIRRHLPSSSDDDVESTTSIATTNSSKLSRQEKSSVLARNLRSLEADDAEQMFKRVYSNVGEALRRLGVQVKILLDITSSLGSPQVNLPLKTPPRTPQLLSPPQSATINGFLAPEPSPGPPPTLVRQDEIQQTLDLSSLLGEAVGIAQDQIIKILKVRVDQTTHLDMPFFLRYFTLNRLFADECEAVSGRSGESLKAIIHDHVRTFVRLTSEAETQKLVEHMDSDKWDAKDFTEEDTKRLEQIVTASTKPIDSWIKATWVWDEGPDLGNHQSLNGILPDNTRKADAVSSENGATAIKDKARGAVLEDEKFVLPSSAIVVLGGIETFERLLQGIPSMSTEISTAILDYIKMFNSRSSQLILGAGATLSAGLKNITTKHLALSSQALNFISTVVPYVREFSRKHTPSHSRMMAEFDDTKRRLQEKRIGIHDKLVEIMTGRASTHISAMKKVDWDLPSDVQVNPYMETLIKETSTLQRVLARHLFESDVQMIMGPVLANYREQWGKAFQGLIIKTQNGKDRLLRDVGFFKSRISKVEGSGDIGDYLYHIAEEKTIPSADSKEEATINGTNSSADAKASGK
ncbi:MAG: hypothetical protein LQ340_003539 [Diploschistes diacapsis]|nr:MAG: hypothetical protein LQ340_003539 [Diploschistes diacapsis]